MEQKIALLINLAVQKMIALATVARNHQIQGYPARDEFCELTKFQSIIDALHNSELSLGDLEEIEEIIKNTGDKGIPPYKPVIVQPDIEVKPKDCCCDNGDIQDSIDDLTRQVNYEKPWLKLTPVGVDEGTYEVGFGSRIIDVNWNANKTPLDLIVVEFPDDPDRGSANLIGTHVGITLDLSAAEETVKKIYGWYNDREPYKGQNLLADDELCFKTKWPCYWGVGPMNALDDPQAINAFALSLTRELSCPGCVEADLQEGEVLYFFFPYKGKAKQFVTDNGVINNSFKGTTESFKTQSLITNNLVGDTTYGVIRTDQPGIGILKVCVKEAEWPEAVAVDPPVEDPVEITYEGVWTNIKCVKEDVEYIADWNNLICVKEESNP